MRTNPVNRPLSRMLTVDEVAYALHVHPTTVRKWEKLGQLKSYRLGARGNVRFKSEDISYFTDLAGQSPSALPSSPPAQHFPRTMLRNTGKKNLHSDKPGPETGAPLAETTEQLEKELRESRESLSSIFSHIPVPLSITRLSDNVIVEINDSFTNLMGYSRQEIIGHKAPEMNLWVNPTERDAMLNLLRTQGRIINQEYQFRAKSGEVHPVLFSAEYITLDGEKCALTMIIDITKRKQISESIKAQRDRAQQYLDISGVIILSTDTLGNVTMINKKGCDVLGYKPEEIIGKNWLYNFVPARVRNELKGLSGNLFSGNTSSNGYYENPVLRKDGEERLIAWHNTVLTDKDGSITGHLSSGEDITDRKEAERALADEATRRRILVDQSRDGIVILDQDGNVYDTNQRFADMLRYSTEEVRHLKIFDWSPEPFNRDVIFKKLHTVNESGDNFETRHRRKDGSLYDVEISTNAATFAGQKLIFCVCRDITDRKEAEKAVLQSEEKFRNLFEYARDAIIIADAETGILIDVNPAGCQMLGRPKDRITGQHMTTLHPPEMAERYKKVFREHVEKGIIMADDSIIQRADGTRIPASVSASVAKLGDKTIIQGVFRDMSGRKEINEKLRFSDAAFKSLHEGVIAVDTDNKINYWNSISEGLFDIKASEAIGKELMNVITLVEIYPGQIEELRQKLEKQGFNRGELLYRTPRGEVWVDMTVQVIKQDQIHYGKIITVLDITGRKQAEEALKESEEKFSKAFNASANAISIRSLKSGRYLEVNDAFSRFTGYTRDEVIGHVGEELNLWVDEAEKKRWTDTIQKEGNAINQEFRSRMKSGEIRFGLGSSEVINIKGEPCRMTVITDITERKKVEEALQDSEEKFSKAFAVSGNAICITSLPESKFVEINDSYCRFTGYSREEVIGHTAAELKLWINQEELKMLGEMLATDGKFHNLEFHSRMKSGEIRVGLGSAEIINIKGQTCRIVVITDITERKKAEEALRDSEEKFSRAFSASANAICITSLKNNRFVEANDAFTRFTGYPREEIIGRSSQDLNLWVKPEELKLWLDTIEKEGRVYNQEFSSRTKSGEVRIGLASAEVINIGGEPCRIVVITDITERKQMEQELLDYRSHLEELVQKRTAELSSVNEQIEAELEERKHIERELLQAKNAAEGANRAKSDFLSRMSHEIRTPIHGVIGTLNLLLDGELKEEQRQYGGMAIASAHSLLGIINDILDFSKIEAGQLALEENDFDLQTTVEDSLQPVALAAHRKGLELTCHIHPDVPASLYGDSVRLRQTLVNLLGNGVKFTQRGEVSADIAVETADESSVELHFTVRDTGIGIPEDKQKQLFTPFVQGNGSKYGGTGLGLAICKQLVTMMEGRIWLESQPGRGSAFHFVIRFKKSNLVMPSASVPAALDNLTGTPVLVLDDNATTRLVLTEMLHSWGLAPTAVENETAALEWLRQIKDKAKRFPVVFIDMMMPGAGGLAIAKKMIGDPALKHNIVMMLPCDSISEKFNSCQEAGFPAHIIKPIKKLDLQKAIFAALGAGGTQKESVKSAPSALHELKLRILVAEDNPTSQVIARKTLERMGCTVEIAGNGREAADLALKDGFDLVLMDFDMPEMNGLEATRVIRGKEAGRGKHLPIVAMTAYAMKQDRDKCLEAGMDGYLTKPINPDSLYNAIKGLMPHFKSDRPPEAASPPENADLPVVDLDVAMRTVGGDKSILKEVLQIFLEEDSPRLFQSIEDAITRQDGKAIKAEAHGLKGAAAALGGKRIAAAAARLEAAGLSGNMAASRTIFEEIRSEMGRFKDFYAKADLEAEGGSR